MSIIETVNFLKSKEAQFILGQPCFMFIREAALWRATGVPIPTRAEDEQAFFLGHLLELAVFHGDKWRDVFADEIIARQARIKTPDDGAMAVEA